MPIHVNCRCQLLLIDPEDEFWTEGKQSGQQLKPLYRTEYDDDGNEVQVKTDPFKGPGDTKRQSRSRVKSSGDVRRRSLAMTTPIIWQLAT